MSDLRAQIDTAKARLPLPALLGRLGLEAHAKKSVCCPFHEDKSPSFSVWQSPRGWQWKCQSGCGNGDEIGFLEVHCRLTRADAIRRFLEMADGNLAPPPMPPPTTEPTTGPELPADATPGTLDDWQELAALRNLSVITPATAAKHLGTLFFGTVHGFLCWILTDSHRVCAEARRMDGRPFPPLDTLGERKAHTLRGSVKSWPVGLTVDRYFAAEFRAILAVEGSPDYLAALDFSLHGTADCLPITFLGAGTASAIHPEALPLLRGKRVRFYPHADESGGDAAEKWAAQLGALGGALDRFEFTGLRKRDGSPVKDLNDCAAIHPDDAGELLEVLP
jgi:hypothetical protein